MWWLFLLAIPVFTLISTTDLNASGFNAEEIAKCMISKSPYAGSFDRWDYVDYCSGRSMTSTERMEVQCKIDELTVYSDPNAFPDESCKCSPDDYNGGWMYDDDDSLERLY
jgi:hypothetical protein